MNSTVELLDTHTGERRRVTLTYPDDCELMSNGISVLDPLGVKLLGCEIGDTVYDDTRKFRITKILYQPEAAGALHL
jgi:regulator of nucleoside diphosphate kinase